MSAMIKLFKCHAINLTEWRWQQVVQKALDGKGPPAPCPLHPSFAGRGLGGSEGAGSPGGQPSFLLWLVQVLSKCPSIRARGLTQALSPPKMSIPQPGEAASRAGASAHSKHSPGQTSPGSPCSLQSFLLVFSPCHHLYPIKIPSRLNLCH